MLAVLELVGLYSDVNKEIIEKRLHPVTRYFVSATNELQEIRKKLMMLPIISPSTSPKGNTSPIKKTGEDGPDFIPNPRFEHVWNFYRKDLIEDN